MSTDTGSANLRKLMDRLGGNPDVFGPLLGLLATTYEFDATFCELDFLPACLGLGGWDDRSWTSRIALEKALSSIEAIVLLMALPRTPALSAPGGAARHRFPGELLHAKVLLLVYERAVRLRPR